MKHKGKIQVINRGCYGTEALISFDSLPRKIKEQVVAKYGNPHDSDKNKYLLRNNIITDGLAESFFSSYILPDGRHLPSDTQLEYTANASVLNAINILINDRTMFRKTLGHGCRDVWKLMGEESNRLKMEYKHTLPENHRRLKQKLEEYKIHGYDVLVSKKFNNRNSAKVISEDQEAMLRGLLRYHTNLDNEQIRDKYNIVACECGWDTITAATVGNYRSKWRVEITHGQRGKSYFDNTIAMQNRRRRTTTPMTFWSIDGWDVELLYQRTDTNKKGQKTTTYHNRLTAVIILDTYCNYPIGYAIGDAENPKLIQEALANALIHSEELFGSKYGVRQLQSDNYAKKTLVSFYEAVSMVYTPARAHNAKAKTIEPYFSRINKEYCQMYPNWSGFGIASGSKRQPNSEYLNKIRTQFPDEAGCRKQIEGMIHMERMKTQEQFMNAFAEMTNDKKLHITDEQFLELFGKTTGFTNRLSAPGLIVTIDGVKRAYDSYDINFRKLSHIDWTVKYNPENTQEVLAVDSSGQYRFMLTEKYVQPEALCERTEDDVIELKRVREFNRNTEQYILETTAKDSKLIEEVFEKHSALDNTLVKLMLVDSNGQHKDQRNANRLEAAQKLIEKTQIADKQREESDWHKQQSEYLKNKVNLETYINQ